eukprot:1099557_1
MFTMSPMPLSYITTPYCHFPSFLIASPPFATHSSVFLCASSCSFTNVSLFVGSIFIHCSIVHLSFNRFRIDFPLVFMFIGGFVSLLKSIRDLGYASFCN